jgi:hypothetical protein
MTKTPEQLAEEYATPRFETYDETKGYQKAQRNAFLAGYQAGERAQEAKIKELENINSNMADDFEGVRSLWLDSQELVIELQAKLDGIDENT